MCPREAFRQFSTHHGLRLAAWGVVVRTWARAHFEGWGENTWPGGGGPTGATPEGVHDLAGNVSEWVHDWYDRYIADRKSVV